MNCAIIEPPVVSRKETIALGRVSYKNTLPLFYKFDLPFVERIVGGTPSQLAKLLDTGLIDGGILSSLYYLTHKERFLLVPDISISSKGAVKSVLLFSKKPLGGIESVVPSPESLTSNFFLYAIFRKFRRQQVAFVPEGGDALLIIGDRALAFPDRASFPYIYDIGELWFRYTGLPAVFALFIVPRGWAIAYPDLFAKLSLALVESRESFFRELEDSDLPAGLKDYLLSLDYHFRREHLESLSLMESLLKEEGDFFSL